MRQPPVASLRVTDDFSSSPLASAEITGSRRTSSGSFLNAGPSKSTVSEKLVSSDLRVMPWPRRVCVTHDNGGRLPVSFCQSRRYS